MTTLIPSTTATPYGLVSTATGQPVRGVRARLDCWMRNRQANTRRALKKRLEIAEKAAITDPLTDVLNRAGFIQQATMRLAEATAYNLPVAVMFWDLNGFGEVNNGLGHATGDRLLAAIGAGFAEHAPPALTVARFGGDEFVMLYRADADLGDQTFRNQVNRELTIFQMVIADRTSDVIGRRLSASVGAVIARPATRVVTLPGLLAAADQAMYRAKNDHTGVVTYPATVPLPHVDIHPEHRVRDQPADNYADIHGDTGEHS